MKLLVCIVLITLISAWDPVRPGTLIKKIGDMIIVNRSVKIVLQFNNVTSIRTNIKNVHQSLQEIETTIHNKNINNNRLGRKIAALAKRVKVLEENFLANPAERSKRAIGVAVAIGALTGLGVANLALHTSLRNDVNSLQYALTQLETLEDATNDIQESLNNVIDHLETLHKDTSNVKDVLNVFMLLDQIHLKTMELDNEVKQFIQDLVMANTGSVTSTLLPIHSLINVIQTAQREWNFFPFFEIDNIAMYYPILTSYLNGTSVVIDIPFSSELTYNIFQFIPFPMNLNGTILSIDTVPVEPQNYILSSDNLKESEITNDNLQLCKRTNLNLFLCPSKLFTLQEALVNSCPASLVKNITVFEHCKFRRITPNTHHINVHHAHYLYFPNITTVSVVCPNFPPNVASIQGLYKVPEQCELHSDRVSTIANRQEMISLKKEFLLVDVDVILPNSSTPMKINKNVMRQKNIVFKTQETDWKVYMVMTILMFIFIVVGVGCMFIIVKRTNSKSVIQHVAQEP